MSDEMNDEMVKAAEALEAAARKYRRLYEKLHPSRPVTWIKHNKTGAGVFITDAQYTEIFKRYL